MRTSFFPMGNINMAKDYIIDYGSNSNGWYRKWKSGWIEQGGQINYVGENSTVQNLPINFSNIDYTIVKSLFSDSFYAGSFYMRWVQIINKTISSFTVYGGNCYWYACGY